MGAGMQLRPLYSPHIGQGRGRMRGRIQGLGHGTAQHQNRHGQRNAAPENIAETQ